MNKIKGFQDIPYLGYRKIQVKNDPIEDFPLLVEQIYQLIKIKRHVLLRNKSIISGVVNKKHANETIKSIITSMIKRK